MGIHHRVRDGSDSHMSHGTQAMNPPFQQMALFFHHMAESMHDLNEINFEKVRKMGGVELKALLILLMLDND